jgi:acetyl-CoA carboxylase carboxyltransferase component
MATVGLRGGVGGTIKAASTELHGREVILVRSDPTTRRGALDIRSSETIAVAADAARHLRVPLILVLSTSGSDVYDADAGLHAWGTAAKAMADLSGVVPVLVVVTGPILAGPSLILGLADVVVMTPDAMAYVVGPDTVEQITGQKLSPAELGGA